MRVLISGAGIAGPALAFWLHRAGAEVTVVERARAPRPGGHAVDIRGTAARTVVGRMGLREPIRAHQVDERGFAMVDRAGRRLAEVPATAFGGEGIVAEIEIARGDLARVLLDATEGVGYRFGDRITAIDGGRVTFASGDAGEYDVIVGADGVHSATRRLVFGPDQRFVRYLGGYTSYFTVPDPGDLDHWMLMHNATGGRVAMIRPETGGTAKASLSFMHPDPGFDRLSRPDAERVITDRLAGAGWRVPELLAAMPSAGDFYFDSVNQVRVDRWWSGRVVLLGDAGWCGSPLAGQGTSMSLVGAYVLAGELAAAGDPEQAFAAYQREMADYVRSGLELPPGGMRMLAPRSRAGIGLRVLSARMMTRWPARQIMAKQFTKGERITLRDYPALAVQRR
ncbi:FAD-dependent monooxygenase [Actinoplanes couchii]|uniref:FAD-dependent oxidoreductase n=1 Tax=Actinoplanes couchii TaxID=403638 RepID=A0ABQ3X5A3_9ACTN|nr:FAD-dependent monooxygenase [Actinoplanes couchii]MDR6326020.1 2-polyprenyl-6-methoxyphenol hydroxylase-like FAD-dependent oxidoreductase [Actinoplanes couchii]GID53627.1 FAD-dependent oxidoreductase [Actinoplanes couchii]